MRLAMRVGISIAVGWCAGMAVLLAFDRITWVAAPVTVLATLIAMRVFR